MVKSIFIGLDLSLTCSGVVVLDDHLDLLKAEAWKPPTKVGILTQRLDWYVAKFDELIRFAVEQTAVGAVLGTAADITAVDIAVENYAYSDGDPHLGELGGVLKLRWLKTSGREMTLVTPTCVKKFASGKGNLPKSLIVASVQDKWGKHDEAVNFLHMGKAAEDVSDAYAVARFRASYVLWEQGKFTPNGYELESLSGKKQAPKSKRGQHRKHKDNEVLLPKEHAK
jgi:hypothetical protein